MTLIARYIHAHIFTCDPVFEHFHELRLHAALHIWSCFCLISIVPLSLLCLVIVFSASLLERHKTARGRSSGQACGLPLVWLIIIFSAHPACRTQQGKKQMRRTAGTWLRHCKKRRSLLPAIWSSLCLPQINLSLSLLAGCSKASGRGGGQ